jgi:hypothetical protein
MIAKPLGRVFSQKKITCECCGRVWIDSEDSITQPCQCKRMLLCARCSRCLLHCVCFNGGKE